MKTYHGSCHCGAVTYDVVADFKEGMRCNCSHCSRKGFVLAFVPKANLTVLSGSDNQTEYRFNKKHIAHLFCRTCGVQCFGYGSDGSDNEMAAVNLNTLEDFNLSEIEIKDVDGKSF